MAKAARIAAALLLASLFGRSVLAQPEPAETPTPLLLTYEEAARIALSDNPDLLLLRYQGEALKLRSSQAMAPANPVFSYTKADVPGLSFFDEGGSEIYAVSFTLGFPGKALAQSASIRHQAESTSEQALSKEIDLLVALSNNYIAFAHNQNVRELLQDEEKRDQDLLKLLEKKFAASQAAKVDLLNAQVVVAKVQQDLLANRNERELLTTQFRQLIRRPEDRNLWPQIPQQIVIPKLDKGLDELNRLMERNRHLLRSNDRLVEAAGSAATAAYLSPLPDFQLSANQTIFTVPAAAPVPGLTRDYSLSIGIAVPLFFPFNELNGIRAASRDRLAAEAQRDSARIQSAADLQNTYVSLTSAQKELENLEKLVVPAAKSSYDLTLLTYGLGKADYFRLNESRKAWLDSVRDMIDKRQAAAQLFNQLIQQIGCDILKTEGPHVCQ